VGPPAGHSALRRRHLHHHPPPPSILTTPHNPPTTPSPPTSRCQQQHHNPPPVPPPPTGSESESVLDPPPVEEEVAPAADLPVVEATPAGSARRRKGTSHPSHRCARHLCRWGRSRGGRQGCALPAGGERGVVPRFDAPPHLSGEGRAKGRGEEL
jgi:type IV secretory pathway VirB10-like protein